MPTELVFARPPTITMVEDVVLVDVDGLTSDWDTYTFSLDILSPGTKRIVLRVQHPDFHKRDCPRVREPYAQSVQLENVMLEYIEAIKSEESTELPPGSMVETSQCHGPSKDIEACVKSELGDNHVTTFIKSEEQVEVRTKLDTAGNGTNVPISPFPCRVLTRCTGNPATEEGMPLQPWKYYVRSFHPSILPHEIARRNEAINACEERLERGEKRRRVL
ncbi:hypothetical protein PISMIDRAFT_20089 [Pisolithus microcarpus 441]|uniref:Uncharacterized protein n=1 Tax=Pisolithus microcarpus 441 TaxID=765257 RepID=A0A0C9Y0Q3_9AGAM|nr:hypothetical protein BKA83DRAFT_20089 [Pisolithus microcarpus]KIK10801.1 hypothetical protein PISMIDRAFT_20089 [Pisolithus microcarpus 441]